MPEACPVVASAGVRTAFPALSQLSLPSPGVFGPCGALFHANLGTPWLFPSILLRGTVKAGKSKCLSLIVELRASCATCHNPHGSLENRALIRFGEETLVAGVSPSASTSILAFVSDGPGSGACYLTCHGVDHGPKAYGALKLWSGERPGPPRQRVLDRSQTGSSRR